MLITVGATARHRLIGCAENASPKAVVVLVIGIAVLIADLDAFKIILEDEVGNAADRV